MSWTTMTTATLTLLEFINEYMAYCSVYKPIKKLMQNEWDMPEENGSEYVISKWICRGDIAIPSIQNNMERKSCAKLLLGCHLVGVGVSFIKFVWRVCNWGKGRGREAGKASEKEEKCKQLLARYVWIWCDTSHTHRRMYLYRVSDLQVRKEYPTA